MAGGIPPYGVAIQQAIASGDVKKMTKAADDAEQHLKKYGDVAGSLKNLRAEISRLGGTKRAGAADSIPYGDALRASIKSGDVAQMKKSAKQAEDWLNKAAEVNKALAEVRKEIKRRGSK
jgi:uncharacterized protein DUF1843